MFFTSDVKSFMYSNSVPKRAVGGRTPSLPCRASAAGGGEGERGEIVTRCDEPFALHAPRHQAMVGGGVTRIRWEACQGARSSRYLGIGNLLPNNQRQRRTCYALCHILYPVSAALASFTGWIRSPPPSPYPLTYGTVHTSYHPAPEIPPPTLPPHPGLPWLERTLYIAPYIAPPHI